SAPYCLHPLSSDCSRTINTYLPLTINSPHYTPFHITATPSRSHTLIPDAYPIPPLSWKHNHHPQLTLPCPMHRLPRLQLALQTPALQPPRPRRGRALQLGRRVRAEVGRGCGCVCGAG